MLTKIPPFWKNAGERCLRGAGIAYVATWQTMGLDFDHLFTVDNVKSGVVGAALSLALSLGFKKAGDKDSGGVY